MRIQVLSDIHTEFHHDWGLSFVGELDPTGVDVLVVAGDLGSCLCVSGVLDALCAKYPYVVYVTGNHEYYHSSLREVDRHLERVVCVRNPNLHWLHDNAVIVSGQRFVGGTLWFLEDPVASSYRKAIRDFSLIHGFEPGVYNRCRRTRAFLRREVGPDDVVVTHHVPSVRLIDPQYARSPLNSFFVCDMTGLIDTGQPKLWIYGHTHRSAVGRFGRTLTVCNPFGYVGGEVNHDFQERFLLDVDDKGARVVASEVLQGTFLEGI